MINRIQKDYDKLRKKEYQFYLEDGQVISLRFKKVNLPHLIGLGKLKNDDEWIMKMDLKQVTAKEIFKKLSEHNRTYEVLKTYPSWTGHLTRRMENFTYENLHMLLKKSTVCEFIYDPDETDNDVAKFVFVDELANLYIHLFIGKDEIKGYYFPNSFIAEFSKHRCCGKSIKIKITKVIIQGDGQTEVIEHDKLKAKLRSIKETMSKINGLYTLISNKIRNKVDESTISQEKEELAQLLSSIRTDLDYVGNIIPLDELMRLKHNYKLAKFYEKLLDGMYDLPISDIAHEHAR